MGWIQLKSFSIKEIVNARKQIHQAAQLPAITGRCLNPKDAGDTFAALYWDKELNALSGQRWEGSDLRSILSISNFKLVIIEGKNNSIDSFKLNGKKYDDAFSWLSERINKLGFNSNKLSKNLPYQIPEYPTAKGEIFNQTSYSAFLELQNYYSNAAFMLENIHTKEKDVSDVLCWPHHFDIATLITIEKNPDPEKVKTIGVGLSPGDESYNEPYFYISPWPYPVNKNNLPKLNHGHWHTGGWFGEVLTSSEIIQSGDNTEQLEITTNFIENGIYKLKKLL